MASNDAQTNVAPSSGPAAGNKTPEPSDNMPTSAEDTLHRKAPPGPTAIGDTQLPSIVPDGIESHANAEQRVQTPADTAPVSSTNGAAASGTDVPTQNPSDSVNASKAAGPASGDDADGAPADGTSVPTANRLGLASASGAAGTAPTTSNAADAPASTTALLHSNTPGSDANGIVLSNSTGTTGTVSTYSGTTPSGVGHSPPTNSRNAALPDSAGLPSTTRGQDQATVKTPETPQPDSDMSDAEAKRIEGFAEERDDDPENWGPFPNGSFNLWHQIKTPEQAFAYVKILRRFHQELKNTSVKTDDVFEMFWDELIEEAKDSLACWQYKEMKHIPARSFFDLVAYKQTIEPLLDGKDGMVAGVLAEQQTMIHEITSGKYPCLFFVTMLSGRR